MGYYATVPFDYAGVPLDRGQVMELGQKPNDEKLTRLRYLVPVEYPDDTHLCDHCGAEFITIGHREEHYRMRHVSRDPQETDRMLDRLDQRLSRDNPLALDQTVASRT